ncbi:MAG TPA: NDP-hexose 4-ketoreductase [Lentisphaeria bacterium]|nr:MAG: NDP-hexose 4-ketoreductase [Lentisphaerae bacterium GWF2_38_69]HBM15404.1 NDP-hexose 4-ketoreductase [Lentisphaeria bacterium]
MNNLTPRARQSLILAQQEAVRFNHDYVGSEHLLLGLIKLGQGVAVSVLKSMGLNLDVVRLEVEKIYGNQGATQIKGELPFNASLKKVLTLSAMEARNMNYNFIGTEHLLLAILAEGENAAAKLLKNLNVNINEVKQEVMMALDPNFVPAENEAPQNQQQGTSQPHGTSSQQKSEFSTLRAFGRDLTELAQRGELDPVIGRKNEIERLIQILCRRNKNNPVLIGEAGVGKTAIVEGLAQAIIAKQVPEVLQDKFVFGLDLPLMIAGTKYRGQFEERIHSVIEEIKASGKVIVFIDELHTIVGAGGAEGAMDASNILKPALARGELQCVGATTMDEYRKYIEKDSALERRFQPIIVNPPSVNETIEILKGIKDHYEDYHCVNYTESALVAAAALSDRYISGRFLPDKAIDIMDEAGARTRITEVVQPPDTKELEIQLEKARKEKDSAVAFQKYEEAARCRDLEKQITSQIAEVRKSWSENKKLNRVKITDSEVSEIVAKLTGIPIKQMQKEESAKLLRMEDDIAKVVIGQNDAVKIISKALRRSRADLKDPRRPIGSFIFLGPTGVGKTLLAKALAEFIFGDPEAIVQLDMSEYMEKFNISRLVGSPPGYIGHDEGGQLSEKIRRRPYSVVLFDEIDKAHPDVLHMLLQIIEEGKLTDNVGRVIDFKNTIVIMTSNLGAHKIIQGKALGFGSADTTAESEKDKERLLEEAKKYFKPEFINRVDDVIIFSKLNREDLRKIVSLEVGKIRDRLKNRDISLALGDEILDFLIEKGYQPEYGARPLRRAIEKYLEDPVSEDILSGIILNGAIVEVRLDNNTLVFIPKKM